MVDHVFLNTLASQGAFVLLAFLAVAGFFFYLFLVLGQYLLIVGLNDGSQVLGAAVRDLHRVSVK